MESLFNDKNLLFNIIMNTDIDDLYTLYETNRFIKSFLNEKYTLSSIAEKYKLIYKDHDFIDIIFEYQVNKINTLTNFRYKNKLSNISKSLKIKLLNYHDIEPSNKSPRSAYTFFVTKNLKLLRDEHPDYDDIQLLIKIGKKRLKMDENAKNVYKEYEIKDIFRYAKNIK